MAYTVNDEKTLKREISSLKNSRDSLPKYLLTLDYDTSHIGAIQRINGIDWLLSAEPLHTSSFYAIYALGKYPLNVDGTPAISDQWRDYLLEKRKLKE